MSKLHQHKSKEEIANFNQVLVQRTIEEAMELANPICTVQLRNIVYVHNQLVKYGDKISIRDFQTENAAANQSELDGSKNQGTQGEGDSANEEEGADDVSSQSSDGASEADPIRMIMD